MTVVIRGSDTPCPICEQLHRDLDRVLGASAPDEWLAARAGERMEAHLTPDVCILPYKGVTRHFVRGHIQLPLLDADEDVFIWSVWVEVDEVSMTSIANSWDDANRAASPPLLGRLATELPYEEPTKGLQITMHTRDRGLTPLLMVSAASRHQIAQEQREGIVLHRVAEFCERLKR